MQESLADLGIMPVRRPARAPQEGIPPTKAERDRLLGAVQQYVRSAAPVPPLSLEELQAHSRRVFETTGLNVEYADFAAVLINNEVWREQLAGIAYRRRLLLLPKCLRDADRCAGEFDEVGLVCRRCGRCNIGDLQAEAEQLGYVVLIAEGSPIVMELLETNQVEAVVGVSCLSVLREVFPYIHAGVVPGMAVPLLYDGCEDTAVDLDWVWEILHLTSEDKTRRLDLDGLRRQVEGWFEPGPLRDVLGEPDSQTERIARAWLARSGKRWRPFLAVCAYQALRDDLDAPLPDDLRKVAVAVECFHKASLVHDDIEDDDKTRYEQETLHAEHGVGVALNVGDLLLGEGYRLIAECGATSGRKVEMLRKAAEGHRMLCLGQGMELCWARKPGPLSPHDVLDIFRRKTAPAFDVALHLGAMYAGAGENVWDVLNHYSDALGIAYQIRDDLDDFTAADGGDVGAARPNLLLALAHEAARGRARDLVEGLWKHPTSPREMPDALRELLAGDEVAGRARQLLESYKRLAVRSLSPLDNASLKGLLRRVVTKIFHDAEVLFCCNDHLSGHARGGRAGPNAAG